MRILDSWNQVLQCKTMRLVKVLWHTEKWNRQRGNARTQCGPQIISYLRTKVRDRIFGIRILLHMHVFVCVCVNFGDEIMLRGEGCKTLKK